VIVDEVDSILIDEARTPLIISGPADGDANKWYLEFARLAVNMRKETDYEVDEKKRTVGILEPGIDKVEDHLGVKNLYESKNTPLIGFLNNAIKAKELFTNNKDYVVIDGEVLIVDEHTGRILPGRRYNDGIHQAIEAKEGVEIKPENQTMATVTLQNYFRMYDKLSGMTGTAETEAAEFMNTYELGVVPIPTNKGVQRIDNPDKVYRDEIAKFKAVVKDIKERHEKGQPILVGTASVENSEYLSRQLAKAGVRHEVLNAKNNEREAAIVAQAGRKGAVVALNPKTGEILAMASSPSYDPNLLSAHTSSSVLANYQALTSDEDSPLFNRAIAGNTYSPGSTFKIIDAVAALESGKYNASSVIANPAQLPLPGTSRKAGASCSRETTASFVAGM